MHMDRWSRMHHGVTHGVRVFGTPPVPGYHCPCTALGMGYLRPVQRGTPQRNGSPGYNALMVLWVLICGPRRV